MKTRRSLGNQAEELVATYLQNQQFTILEKNYRRFYGEIDLIATKGDLLVFVEVKMRSSHYFPLSDVITPLKQHKITLVAKDYIARHDIHDKVGQFDVALLEQQNNQLTLTYIPNAFTSSD